MHLNSTGLYPKIENLTANNETWTSKFKLDLYYHSDGRGQHAADSGLF